jgi:acetylornithine deacetylase/succinyl-diaminopimelate desuccinylase-like protein
VVDRLIELAIQIQRIPAPSFEEAHRAEFVQHMFRESSDILTDIQMDSAGNVLSRLPGDGSGAPLVVSAHLDTVFPGDTNLDCRREGGRIYGPGIGDNSLGVAGLFGLLWRLRERASHLPGDVWFVANTCEEGLGDLRGMKAVVERFGSTPKAYLVLEGMALGHVYYKAVGVRRYKISVRAPGGHSWIEFGQPSAIHELASLIANIASIKPPANPHTTFNVGRIGGGTSINTIAASAWMELDLRSETQEWLAKLVRQVENLVDRSEKPGVTIDMEIIGQRPVGEISPDHSIPRLARSCLREQGFEPVMTVGSTDANIPLSMGYPTIVLGLTHGGGAHTLLEYIETVDLDRGLEHIVQFTSRVWT